jgi:alpha-N-acetylglucosaminidase
MVRQNLMRWHLTCIRVAILVVLVVSHAVLLAGNNGKQPGVESVQRALDRIVGTRSSSFELSLMRGKDTLDTFELTARNGRVAVRGTSPVALLRGVYHYLRNSCHCMITWSGSNLNLPDTLPDCAPITVKSPYKCRQMYNVCTFGYTTVWWDWARWEREIDWMALHGVDMPLALVGQTSVWQRVWESFGIPRDSLRTFFTGPAFLPWHWMGNINVHGGPLPQVWIDQQEQLQKRILGRMRELGMTPIVPAFSGFVPEAFRRRFPAERLNENRGWSGLPDENRTLVLSPRSAMFPVVGERFIREYRRTFGPCSYYLADTFNELDVQVSQERRYDELAEYGSAVYQSIVRGDPAGTWVMQGWLFNHSAAFWDAPSTQALLSKVPDDRMIILDLANEEFKGWKVHEAFYGKQWIYSTIHNFGGNNSLRGDMPFVASDPPTALHDSTRGRLVGYGMAPEGLENNEVMYELLTDMAWRTEPVGLRSWLRDYVIARYGRSTAGVERAWQHLQESVYGHRPAGHHTLYAYQYRPSLVPHSDVPTDERVDQALDILLGEAEQFKGSTLFTHDLIDVAVYATGCRIDRKLSEACRAHLSSDPALRDTLAHEADTLMLMLDAIINTRNDARLERWIAMARDEGSTAEQKSLMEQNARRQITVWGGPNLSEYAAKIWSGMVRDYYAPRWRTFFAMLRGRGAVPDLQNQLRAWDEQWWTRSELSRPIAVQDPVSAINALLRLERHMAKVAAEPVMRTSTPIFVEGDSAVVTISAEADAVVRYTSDGTMPGQSSPMYTTPLVFHENQEVRARGFVQGKWNSTVSTLSLRQTGNRNGLLSRYFPEPVSDLTDSAWMKLHGGKSGHTFGFEVCPDSARLKNYALDFTGYLLIDTSGDYTFTTESDDGSRLYIDGLCVVENDGYHGAREKWGVKWLEQGYHPIEVRYFQSGGASLLNVQYKGPGVPRQPLPLEKLFTKIDR